MKRVKAAGDESHKRPNSALPNHFNPSNADLRELISVLSDWQLQHDWFPGDAVKTGKLRFDISWAFTELASHDKWHAPQRSANVAKSLRKIEGKLTRLLKQLETDQALIGDGLTRYLDPADGGLAEIARQMGRLKGAAVEYSRWIVAEKLDRGPLLPSEGATPNDAFLSRLAKAFQDAFGEGATSADGKAPSAAFIAFVTTVTVQAAASKVDGAGRGMTPEAVVAAYRRALEKAADKG